MTALVIEYRHLVRTPGHLAFNFKYSPHLYKPYLLSQCLWYLVLNAVH